MTLLTLDPPGPGDAAATAPTAPAAAHHLPPPVGLVARCTEASWALLERNTTPGGVLAATAGEQAAARRYTRVFGRDAAICVLAMAGSGRPVLEQGAIASLDALAAGQAPNGQIPKFVDPDGEGDGADFWYLGCIDATLWWLIAVDHVRRASADAALATRWAPQERLALQWLRAQEHPTLHLLQQNEASDWADIMPRSGYVLYTNALWFRVKQLYGLADAESTHDHFLQLFHPFGRQVPANRRVRLLGHYVKRGQRNPGLFLSFVNLSFAGDEGDVFGNVLALLYGLAGDAMGQQIIKTLIAGGASTPYPARAVMRPIAPEDDMWRLYMGRHQQNLPHQYHNGGIWPFIGGFWAMALAQLGHHDLARTELAKLAQANAAADWRFSEWFHGQTLAPSGMPGQSWNAAAFLIARQAIETGRFAM